ncbi:hypothetical protein WMF20_04945 [Sorangium sp. So ce834]|uniref:hypothetical protein n=1 Tax=Sorangium sp. So ce834 TaxID=3133321 RepID=UPI003F63C13A
MDFISRVTEQLDLAAQQLHQRTPTHARFALILIDNIVELILHGWCEDACKADASLAKLGQVKLSRKERKAALGQRFDEKPKFCARLGYIDEPQRDFILDCHSYRNEPYHVSLAYEEIIEPIASEYYLLACDLLLTHERHSFTRSFPDETSRGAFLKHAGQPAAPHDHGKIFGPASQSLRNARPQPSTSLQRALFTSMFWRVEAISGTLDFLMKAAPRHESKDELLLELESRAAWLTHIDSRADAAAPSQDSHLYHEERQMFQASYKQKFHAAALERWRDRAKQLRDEPDAYLALKEHEALRRECEPYAELVFEAAAEMDAELQRQFDEAFGR